MKKYLVITFALLLSACSYKFNGASIPPEMKTIKVYFFENNATLVVPYLSQQFTEDLKTRIRNQTKLNIIQTEAHGAFEGRITAYSINPVAIQNNANPVPGANRMSITVSVKYTNEINPKNNYEESFTRFKDFVLGSQSLQSLEAQLIKDINVQLTEDIFNRAFAQW
ncbi:MAG: hypothetical protein K2Q03_00140 [Sphingobacteriaceae bacterium]|nr:hypothetical protein [Sphingobacteriaceae bacterium]